MRIACVAGFFNPVKKILDQQFEAQLEDRSLLWIPQVSNGEFNVNLLKQALFDAVGQNADEIFILLFVLRSKEYLRDIVNSLVQEAQARSPHLKITVNSSIKNAQDGKTVASLITDFAPTPAIKDYPASLEQLDPWITETHGSKLILLPRARNNLSKSRFDDVRLIYESIDMLAIEYHTMKIATPHDSEACRLAFENKMLALGLECGPSITPARAGEEGDEYFVYYPTGQLKTKKLLDLHLKKGSDRDERFCLRIYFFWDGDARKAVIGWLPNHLETRSS